METTFTNIKAILMDVDGVMTDGGIYYDSQGNELKKFNVKDGLICSVLKSQGVLLGIITGRKSSIVQHRFEELGFDSIRQGIHKKVEALEEFCQVYNCSHDEICYVGDDVNDLGIIRKVGLSFCPSDAVLAVKEEVDVVLPIAGGQGVLRSVGDLLLQERGYTF